MIINAFMRKLKKIILLNKFNKNNCIELPINFGHSVLLNHSKIEAYVRIAHSASIISSTIGSYSCIGRYTKITHTKLGKFCAISWDCTINAVSHPYTHLTINAFPYVPYVGDFVSERSQIHEIVEIGNDVWVGGNSVIMPGIVIEDGAVIGAGAVVTKDVPAYAIVAGVPAKIIKYRFKEDVIKKLLKIQWWNIDRKIIKENIHLFQGEFTDKKLRELEELCK